MRFPPHILDEIRARLPVSQVVSRKVALKKKGREFAGLSPFKVEKTPSFFVNDQKGFYHCFASGEHGDIFKFVMTTEGLTFPEAVERLAQEAGVQLPKPEARDEKREDERARLYALLEASGRFFTRELAAAVGTEARRYIEKRGLKRDTVDKFRLGYAPNSRTALKEHLAREGFTPAEMALAGMLIAGEDIREPYDRFRHRVMFPILDMKGRIIAFGGRALSPDAQAKYLNSPETPLFHKGHVLFNAATARAAAHDKGRVIAVEGYMDAISLAEAGFPETVAPLGTALTEEQVALMWRMTREPILCLDGDSAGRKAAFRAIDTVLPHLKPGVSLSFAFLPDGLDPDDLVRQQGAEAFAAVLARARPLADVLWDREWASGDWGTPERRARLEQQIKLLIARIADNSVRGHYEQEMRQRLARAWGRDTPAAAAQRAGDGRRWDGAQRPYQPGQPNGGRPAAQPFRQGGQRPGGYAGGRGGPGAPFPAPRPHASSSLRTSRLVAGDAAAPPYREALLLRALLNHPWLIDVDSETIADLPLTSPALARLRDAILSVHALDNSLDRTSLRSQLSKSGVSKVVDLVERAITHRSDKFAEPDADAGEVEVGWRHALALHERQVGLRRSLDAAERAFHADGDETALARICEIQRQLERLSEPEGSELAEAQARTGRQP